MGEKNLLVEVFKENKAILLITAFTVGGYTTAFMLLQSRVNANEIANEARFCKVEAKFEKLDKFEGKLENIDKNVERLLRIHIK